MENGWHELHPGKRVQKIINAPYLLTTGSCSQLPVGHVTCDYSCEATGCGLVVVSVRDAGSVFWAECRSAHIPGRAHGPSVLISSSTFQMGALLNQICSNSFLNFYF